MGFQLSTGAALARADQCLGISRSRRGQIPQGAPVRRDGHGAIRANGTETDVRRLLGRL
jgi:hypothetical protein